MQSKSGLISHLSNIKEDMHTYQLDDLRAIYRHQKIHLYHHSNKKSKTLHYFRVMESYNMTAFQSFI